MNLELHLRIVGVLQLALAAAHAPFPRWFNWRKELSLLSLLNRQIFIVHTLFLVLVLAMFGAVSLLAPGALMERTRLGVLVCAGLAGFWFLRLWVQFFVYDSRLWRGQRGRTAIHVGVSILWVYLAVVYGAAVVGHLVGGR